MNIKQMIATGILGGASAPAGPTYETPAYANVGGTGDRTALITTTTTVVIPGGAITTLVDGAKINNTWFQDGESNVGKVVKFVFPQKVLITEATWYQDAPGASGNWKWVIDPDNDGHPQDVGGTFELGTIATQTLNTLSGNTTGAKAYWMQGVGGNTSAAAYIREIEFKIGNPT